MTGSKVICQLRNVYALFIEGARLTIVFTAGRSGCVLTLTTTLTLKIGGYEISDNVCSQFIEKTAKEISTTLVGSYYLVSPASPFILEVNVNVTELAASASISIDCPLVSIIIIIITIFVLK